MIYSFRNLVIGYSILIVVVLLVLLSTFSNFRSQEKQLGEIEISREVFQKLGSVTGNLNEFVFGLSNYINSEDEKRSNFYTEGLVKLKNDSLEIIEIVNSDSPKRNEKDYRQLADLVHEATGIVTSILHTKDLQGFEAARAELKKETLLKTSLSFKTLVEKIENDNRQVLSAAYNKNFKLTRRTFVFIGVISSLLILFLLTNFLLRFKDLKNRFTYNSNLEKFRKALNNSADAVYIIDRATMRYIDINDAAYVSTGYSKEELLTKGPQHLRRLDTEEALARIYDDVILSPQKRRTENTKYFRKDGSSFDAEISIQAMKDGNKDIMIVVARDITERKKAEEQLKKFNEELEKQVNEKTADIKESEERYRILIEHASDAIFINDLQGNLLDVNNNACKMLGYTKKELCNLNVSNLFTREELSLKPIMYDELEKGDRTSVERSILRKNGSEVPVDITAKMLPDGRIVAIARDITERKKAAEALAESENYLRTIVQTEPECIKLLGINGELKDMNPAGLAMIEADSIEQVKGALVLEIVNEPYKKSFDQLTRNVFKGNSGTLEFEITGLKGTRRWLETHAVPMKNTEGKIILLLGVTRDITERKKTAEALRNNELRFRTLTVNAPVGIFQTDVNGKTIYVNETWKQYTGMRFKEAMGDGWVQTVHPDDREMLVKEWEDKSQKGLRSSLEYRLLNKNGNIRWVSGNAIPLFNQAGEITGYIGTISDITERKNTEQIIRNSEETRKLIMNSALDAIICMNTEGQITVWTPQAEKIFGWNEKEAIGKIMTDFIIPSQFRERHKKGLAHYLKTGEGPILNRIFEITALNHEGHEFPIEISVIPIKQDNTEFFCSFIRDISDRKKAELELEESYKAIRKLTAHLQNIREEERTHVAREVHDELGQHLTVLKMDITWLSKKISKSADDEVKEKMNDLLNIIDGTIKTVRRISAELRPSLLDDLGLVAALEWQLDEFEKRSGIKTNFEEPDEEVKLTTAVKTGLFRIFQESLTNVARHAGATKVKVSLVQTQGSVELNITDNGKGFDKLKIADKRTLGLLGMRERTAMIGGTYDIISTPGKGTKVVVTIPLETDNIKTPV